MKTKVDALHESTLQILECHMKCHIGRNANLCEHAFVSSLGL